MASRGSYKWAVAAYGKPCEPSVIHRMALTPEVNIWVDRRTVVVWQAMAKVMAHHGYTIRPGDTGAYNCRPTTGGSTPSRHAHGIACDVNWQTNPYIRTPTLRKIRWGIDTDMPAVMVNDIESITAGDGVQALTWGGRWRTVKDAMHWQLNVTPTEIKQGVHAPHNIDVEGDDDMETVKRGDRGNTVGLYQTAINRWVKQHNIQMPVDADITIDEVFGAGFERAVMVYQAAADIPQTGVIGGITAANLARYVPAIATDVFDHSHTIAASTEGIQLS